MKEFLMTRVRRNIDSTICKIITRTKKAIQTSCKDCIFREEGAKIYSLELLFEEYGKMLLCLTFHDLKMDKIPLIDLFMLDNYILELIHEDNEYTVENTLINCTNNFSARRKSLIEIVVSYFKEDKMKIYCEQDLESLLYKFYKRFPEKFDSIGSLNLLLILLYKRNESHRFFRVYAAVNEKSILIYRLGLLLTISNQSCLEPDAFLEEVERSFEVNDLKSIQLPFLQEERKDSKNIDGVHSECCKENIQSPVENGESLNENVEDFVIGLKEFPPAENLEETDEDQSATKSDEINYSPDELEIYKSFIDDLPSFKNATSFEELSDWFERNKNYIHWSDCVKMWSSSRKDGEGAVDTAMLDVCVDYRKYEQGWMIYCDRANQENLDIFARAANLCFSALIYTGDEIWMDRAGGIMKTAIQRGLNELCCNIVRVSINAIRGATEANKVNVFRVIMGYMEEVDFNDETTCCVLKEISTLCSKCENSHICGFCRECANRIFHFWREHKDNDSGIFRRRKDNWDDSIYCDMLGVFTVTGDADGLYNVCKELKHSKDISEKVVNILEEYHNEKNCKCGIHLNKCLKMSDRKCLIDHLLEDLK